MHSPCSPCNDASRTRPIRKILQNRFVVRDVRRSYLLLISLSVRPHDVFAAFGMPTSHVGKLMRIELLHELPEGHFRNATAPQTVVGQPASLRVAAIHHLNLSCLLIRMRLDLMLQVTLYF